MLISGIQRFSVLDFPDKVSCIVFTPGCNFRCGMCHNPEFVLPKKIKELKKSFIPESVVFRFLEKRKRLLDGVVITGGEPTLMKDLGLFLRKIKDMGFLVKIDTNGSQSGVLEKLFQEHVIDYTAMDIKTSLELYSQFVGQDTSGDEILKSIDHIINSGRAYEFRSTLIQELHPPEVIKKMAELIRGAKTLYLQTFRPQKTLKREFRAYHALTPKQMRTAQRIFQKCVENVYIRMV